MNKSISLHATIDLPLSAISDAFEAEIARAIALTRSAPTPAQRQSLKDLIAAVDRVTLALDALEKATHTVGESKAREQFMQSALFLRLANRNYRSL